MNVEVSNHMQALEDDQIKTLDKSLDHKKVTTIQNKTLKIITKNNKTITILKIITNRTTKVTRIKKAIITTKIMPKIIKITKIIRTIKIIKQQR